MTEAYVTRKGMYLHGGKNTLAPIFPFFILDVEHQIYMKDIRSNEYRGRSKQIANRWGHSYSVINREFFHCFSDEQVDEIIEKMDEFNDAVSNNVMIAKVAFMNLLSDRSIEELTFFSSCLLCNTLAQSAQIFWEMCWKDEKGKGLRNHHIDSIRHCAKTLLNLNYKGKVINCNYNKACNDAVNALSTKIVDWLKTN